MSDPHLASISESLATKLEITVLQATGGRLGALARLRFSFIQLLEQDPSYIELTVKILRYLVELPPDAAARRIAMAIAEGHFDQTQAGRRAAKQAYEQQFEPPPCPPVRPIPLRGCRPRPS